MTKGVIYRVLSILGIVVIFVVGVWLGRLYSAAGGPGAVTLQRFGSTVVEQIRRLGESSATPVVESTDFNVTRLNVVEVKERLDSGSDIVVVDVRSKEEYDAGHIAGAISIPWTQDMDARYLELPRDKEIITYCGRC